MDRLSTFSDIANVIIAGVSMLLAFYIFIYQQEKDKKDTFESQKQAEQNLRLQWFKELIVQPNLNRINEFYHLALNQIPRIEHADEDEKQNINKEIKTTYYDLRRKFIDLLAVVDIKLYQNVGDNLEELVDAISDIIFNEQETSDTPFAKNLETQIIESQKQLIKDIYSFKGTS